MDLEFKEGDTIELLEKVDVDWFKGKIGQREGIVSYILSRHAVIAV